MEKKTIYFSKFYGEAGIDVSYFYVSILNPDAKVESKIIEKCSQYTTLNLILCILDSSLSSIFCAPCQAALYMVEKVTPICFTIS